MAAHLEKAFSHLPPAELPNTEMLSTRSLILPLFHAMTDDDQIAVANVLRRHAGMSPA
jgi:perosamine synthetase